MNQKQSSDKLKFTSKFNPSGIIMLDGLKRDDIREKQTGRNIFNYLRDSNDFSDKQMLLERHPIATAEALIEELRRFEREFPEDFSLILHLECHGSDTGIEIGDTREAVAWNDLLELVAKINIKNKCNVGLVLACCNGYGSFQVGDMAKPVPFYFQLSHRGRIAAGELEESLIAFYKAILTDHDIIKAIKAAAPFEMKYAEKIFADLMYRILHAEPRSKFVKQQISAILSGVLAQGGIGGDPDLSYNRKLVKSKYGTFEQLIAHNIKIHMSFFCGRKPAFDFQQLVRWIADGQTLV
jgi:hypothetical protein